MLSLNIKLNCIRFSQSVVNPEDTIRVSITTLPDSQKEAFTFDIKDIQTVQPSFTIKFNKNTKKIIIVFRKKSFFSNGQIFASTCIKTDDIKLYSEISNDCHNIIDLFEPIQHSSENENLEIKKLRRIVGNMEIFFSLKEYFPVKNYGINLEKIEQRTYRMKMNNNLYLSKKKENNYIFN